MKMLKNHFTASCIAMLLCMTLFGCTKVNQTEKLNNPIVAESNSKHYYYYENKKRGLRLNTEYINVIAKKKLHRTYENIGIVTNSSKSNSIKVSSDTKGVKKNGELYKGKLKLTKKLAEDEYIKLMKSFYEDPNIEYVSPYFEEPQGLVSYSNFFRVKLNSESDFSILANVANNYGVIIIKQNEFMPLWYILQCTNVNQDAMDMANAFYQTGLFSTAEPDFYLFDESLTCSSGDMFFMQWGFNNTGQFGGNFGIDIKACQALGLTRQTGAVIDVAVIDRGIDLNHEDLVSDLYGPMKSYNCETKTSPSFISVVDYFPSDPGHYSHGVAVAGIIGARENNKGITGVAPHSRLMSVSHSFSPLRNNALDDLADGINWSIQEGAEVINLSWISMESQIIKDAINKAVTYGRSGKGCIIIAGAGNYDAPVSFPARYNNVIAVGAINQCGTLQGVLGCDNNAPRFYHSSYGANLDVVAPGIRIATTDMTGPLGYSSNNYVDNFAGTSAAAPYVAGVAALILSKNPTLTGYEVRNIIESTAQRVGVYQYAITPGRNNGPWHEKMGYGLVDAYAALLNTPAGGANGIEYYVTYLPHN